MGIEKLDRIFNPKTVAVVGASAREGSVGHAILNNLIHNGFEGEIIPVNPRQKEILGRPAYSNISEIPEDVDLVVVATPIGQVPEIVDACNCLDSGGIIIISGGGKEAGTEGRKIEAEILKKARAAGLRIIGPNCLGIINTRNKLNASFSNQMPLAGKMAFISQSGGINTAILDLSIREKIGFSYFISLGSMLDVNFGDMIDYLGADPEVSSIVMYIENLTRFRAFMGAARAVSRVKPIIALKAGRTAAGAVAAMSHTGAMAGEDTVYDAAFKRAGIIRVKTFEELFDCAELAARQPKIKGPGLAILTNSGGPGVMATDALSDYGARPVSFAPETLEKLNAALPYNWSHGNPVDILGDAGEELFSNVFNICRNANEVDGILFMMIPDAVNDPTAIAKRLIADIKEKDFPVFTVWLGGTAVEAGRDLLNHANIPTFDSPERAIRAYMDLYQHTRNLENLQQIPSRLPKNFTFQRHEADSLIQKSLSQKRHLLSEPDAKELLRFYGIPVNKTFNVPSLVQANIVAKSLGFPVAMKINAQGISHKSDAGGVRLNLKNAAEVATAFEEITTAAKNLHPDAIIEGVAIQEMVPPPDFELIIGAQKDPDFGPVILFGLGGVFTEIIKDRAIGLPPLNRLLAREIMAGTKAYQLVMGYRHFPRADIEKLEEILIRVAQLVTDFPQIEELDINPVFVSGDHIMAVDARVVLKPSHVVSPQHLVISAYPDEMEQQIMVETLGKVTIRPIKPEDAPLMVALFQSLSKQSVYNRFFSPLKQLPMSMLSRLTQIDYDREIALVATQIDSGEEKMLGVARIIVDPGSQDSAEFAVLVGDPWQGLGIGAALLSRCLCMAKKRCIKRVWGIVLSENIQMLALGHKLGFKIKRDTNATEYILSCDLTQLSNGGLRSK